MYRQIASQIRAEIQAGRLARGERLPAIRDLAGRLGVNRDTVSLAYDRLSREGVVSSAVGRGTFVNGDAPEAASQAIGARALPLAAGVERLLDFERARPRFAAAPETAPLHALTPDPSLYPLRAFRRSLNRVLAEGGADLLVYGGHQGNDPLRQAIGEHLSGHGIAQPGARMVLCHGASQGISLALRLYAEPGDWVGVEEPTYHNVLAAITALGLRAAPVPMTREGPDLEALERTLARPEVKLFYTMPSFHNPMGITTSLAHRRALLGVASRVEKPVVEDGFEMDLRFAGRQVPPLAALDRSGLVVHLFSFSKSLFPGVRVGAITAAGRAVDGLLALKQATDLSGSLVLQAAVADFVRSGAYGRHLRSLRRALRERRDTLLEALAAHMPEGTRWTRPDGGYQVWVSLPEPLDSRALLADAEREGVAFAPGYQFHHDGRPSSSLRLTTALADGPAIRRGVAALAAATRAHLGRAGTSAARAGIQV